jgi:hypothetical protein
VGETGGAALLGFKWPHHIFVNQDFKVIGANQPIS